MFALYIELLTFNTLRQLVEEKINECKGDIHESHNPVFNNMMLIDIQTLDGF
jgi:hypothetical protein